MAAPVDPAAAPPLISNDAVVLGLLAAVGMPSYADLSARQRLAAAVLQAALEVEATRESARYVLYRGHAVPLVVATPDSTPQLCEIESIWHSSLVCEPSGVPSSK